MGRPDSSKILACLFGQIAGGIKSTSSVVAWHSDNWVMDFARRLTSASSIAVRRAKKAEATRWLFCGCRAAAQSIHQRQFHLLVEWTSIGKSSSVCQDVGLKFGQTAKNGFRGLMCFVIILCLKLISYFSFYSLTCATAPDQFSLLTPTIVCSLPIKCIDYFTPSAGSKVYWPTTCKWFWPVTLMTWVNVAPVLCFCLWCLLINKKNYFPLRFRAIHFPLKEKLNK